MVIVIIIWGLKDEVRQESPCIVTGDQYLRSTAQSNRECGKEK